MEVIVPGFHAAFPMDDASRVGQARREAVERAHDCGFDEVEVGRVALVVTELGNNLVRHAHGGRLWLAADPQRHVVEVIAVDQGPGIADLARSLDDGYSTAGTPGTGLGAVRRLASHVDIHSDVPEGTIVVARLEGSNCASPRGDSPAIEAAAVSLPAPGEAVCGDACAFALDGPLASAMVVDGLGHGVDAAAAAHAALAVFRQQPFAAPGTLIAATHEALRGMRGAAVMAVQADARQWLIRSAGAGNIIGRLVSGTFDRSLLGQHGTAGLAIRRPGEVTTPWPPHALLVLCSDGLETRWKQQLLVPVLGRDPAIAAALLMRQASRGRDDATVAVLRRNA